MKVRHRRKREYTEIRLISKIALPYVLLHEKATGVQRRNSSFKLGKCAKAELGWSGKVGFGDRKGAYKFEDWRDLADLGVCSPTIPMT